MENLIIYDGFTLPKLYKPKKPKKINWVKKSPTDVYYISPINLYNLIKKNWLVIQTNFKTDTYYIKSLVKYAIKQNYKSLIYLTNFDSTNLTLDIYEYAVSINFKALKLINDEDKLNQIVLDLIESNPEIIKYVKKLTMQNLKNYIKINPQVINYVNIDMDYSDLYINIINENNQNIFKYINNPTLKVCKAAVFNNYKNFKYINNEYISNLYNKNISTLYDKFLNSNIRVIKYIKNQTFDMCINAVKQNKKYIKYVNPEFIIPIYEYFDFENLWPECKFLVDNSLFVKTVIKNGPEYLWGLKYLDNPDLYIDSLIDIYPIEIYKYMSMGKKNEFTSKIISKYNNDITIIKHILKYNKTFNEDIYISLLNYDPLYIKKISIEHQTENICKCALQYDITFGQYIKDKNLRLKIYEEKIIKSSKKYWILLDNKKTQYDILANRKLLVCAFRSDINKLARRNMLINYNDIFNEYKVLDPEWNIIYKNNYDEIIQKLLSDDYILYI